VTGGFVCGIVHQFFWLFVWCTFDMFRRWYYVVCMVCFLYIYLDQLFVYVRVCVLLIVCVYLLFLCLFVKKLNSYYSHLLITGFSLSLSLTLYTYIYIYIYIYI